MKDKNGNMLFKGASVMVDEPTNPKDDGYNNEFFGHVDSFRSDFVVVIDMEGDAFCVEPKKISLDLEI